MARYFTRCVRCFQVGSVYFTDALNLVVRCSAKSGYNVPSGISGSYTVVNHQMSGDVIPRAIHSPPLDTVWSDLDFVNFTATTVSDSGKLVGEDWWGGMISVYFILCL